MQRVLEDNESLEIKKETVSSVFNIYSLTDLSLAQIKTFLKGKGIGDTTKILDDIEIHDAWNYTTRPQDLE